MAKKPGHDGWGESGMERLERGMAQGISNVASFAFGKWRTACFGLSVRRRERDDWLATMRVYSSAVDAWLVAFGNGPTLTAALMALNASIAKGRFHDDKFAQDEQPQWAVERWEQPSQSPALEVGE